MISIAIAILFLTSVFCPLTSAAAPLPNDCVLVVAAAVTGGTPLPNDCVITALEVEHAMRAHARLKRIDVWSRVLLVSFSDREMGHAFCVFQPAAPKPGEGGLRSKNLCAYDALLINGTLTLYTASRDPGNIARSIGIRLGLPIVNGRFLD